ncbi:MAG: prepilin-type N-terminal cleavage/methylation domain-containing protein [Candidatus Moranbacteria bacterium]|nr:prepilin-type N-terminal cleavage/methylation domain-containing protein [Candidatus Moranbacteria bacterium]
MIQNSKFKIKNSKKGFTLIEMLVVIFVLGIGLVGALSFFNINLNSQFEAKNELIAAGLAQEGADLVRNIRDYNQLNSSTRTWDQELAACNNKGIDFNSLTGALAQLHKCVSNTNVYIDSNSRYNQSGSGTTAAFTRKIEVTAPDAASRKIICTVSWNGRTTTATDILYNNSY